MVRSSRCSGCSRDVCERCRQRRQGSRSINLPRSRFTRFARGRACAAGWTTQTPPGQASAVRGLPAKVHQCAKLVPARPARWPVSGRRWPVRMQPELATRARPTVSIQAIRHHTGCRRILRRIAARPGTDPTGRRKTSPPTMRSSPRSGPGRRHCDMVVLTG
jgi:hypothetical protein